MVSKRKTEAEPDDEHLDVSFMASDAALKALRTETLAELDSLKARVAELEASVAKPVEPEWARPELDDLRREMADLRRRLDGALAIGARPQLRPEG